MGDEDPKAPADPNPEAGQDAHERPDDEAPEARPGVPPPSTDDVEGDKVDEESAQSFPASDPPANY